jgi:putative SOS response-associated peptidase YedK
MCGRYTLYQTGELAERFDLVEEEIQEIEADLKDRYNIAPTQILPTITERDSKKHIELMRWGYLPPWAKNERTVFKYRTFNARSEGIFEKPMWKRAIRERRCLVPSSGFYEWKDTPYGKQPYFIHPKDQGLFAFAGIYGSWKDAEGIEWHTYSILTTDPNHEMVEIHNRMPVILHPDDEDIWLDANTTDRNTINELLQPYEDGMLDMYEVSRDVNTSRVDSKTLIGPVHTK